MHRGGSEYNHKIIQKLRWKGFLKVSSESLAQSRVSVKVGHVFSAHVRSSLSSKRAILSRCFNA